MGDGIIVENIRTQRIKKLVGQCRKGVGIKRFARIPYLKIGEELVFETENRFAVPPFYRFQNPPDVSFHFRFQYRRVGIQWNLGVRLHAENPVASTIGPTDYPARNLIGYHGNEVRFALRRKEIGFDVSRSGELKRYAASSAFRGKPRKHRTHAFVLGFEIGDSARRRSELGGSPHGCGNAKAVAAFRADDVRRVLASEAYGKEVVAIRGIFGSGKTFAQALGEMVRIHVGVDGVGIRFAPPDDDDSLPRKNFLQRFVGRRIRVIEKEFADELPVRVFASDDSDEIVSEQVVGKAFVANEDYRVCAKYLAKAHEHAADVFVGNFHEPVGRKGRIIWKGEPFDFLGGSPSLGSFGQNLRYPERKDGRKPEHSPVRIVPVGVNRRIERYRADVWNHGKPLRKVSGKGVDFRDDFRNGQKRTSSGSHLMASSTEFSGDDADVDVVLFGTERNPVPAFRIFF